MTRDEMKNKISLALKDPILQQGFECICKENAELKAFKEKCKFNVSDIFKEIETENKLTKAKELIKTLLLIADNKVSQMEFQLCVADAKQFLEENK